MTLRPLLALAAFAVAVAGAGAALAQDALPPPPSPTFTIPDLDQYVRSEAVTASREVHRACAAEMRTLCPGKAGAAADRCLVYHRLNFSKSCRAAITGFEAAAAPLGEGETLTDFRPYSLVQPRRHAPARSSPPIPAAPVAAAATGA